MQMSTHVSELVVWRRPSCSAERFTFMALRYCVEIALRMRQDIQASGP